MGINDINTYVFLTLFTELTFTWIFNEYPSFVIQDTRRFVSQKTGNLYIAKVEPSDVGNYTCVVTNTVTKSSVQGPPTPLVLRVDGMRVLPYLLYIGYKVGPE